MRKKQATPKLKESVKLRQKQLANGNQSLYLDIYNNGNRSYEFLKLYLVPANDEAHKTQNQNTMKAAKAIQAQRYNDLLEGKSGITFKSTKGNINLIDWIKNKKIATARTEATKRNYLSLVSLLSEYKESAKLKDIDKGFIKGFVKFMGQRQCKRGSSYKASSVKQELNLLATALSSAVKAEIISSNPVALLEDADKPKAQEAQVCFLDFAEVKALEEAPCRFPSVKAAFLFSCFCGLRVSDIEQLTWGNIHDEDGTPVVVKQMKKTKEEVRVPLGKQALQWLPDRGAASDSDAVFNLPSRMAISYHLLDWAAAAGIKKHVTFHVARHTYATMMLTAGVDLYTTSKLLGHSDIKVTQRYAEVVDRKKVAAASALDTAFNNQ